MRNGILLFLLLFPPLTLFPQMKNLRFYSYSTDEGLPQNSVYAILQDHYGYLWIGTEDGLARFDGLSFNVYKHNPRDSNSISNNVITRIFEDSKYRLWIGTAYGGVTVMDSSRKNIRWIQAAENGQGLISNRVQDIVEDQQGFIWIGTEKGVDRINPESGEIIHFLPGDKSGEELNDGIVADMQCMRDGSLWIATMRGGINVFRPPSGNFDYITMGPSSPILLPENRIRILYEDPVDTNLVWIGLRLEGVLKVDRRKGIVRHFSTKSTQYPLPSDYIRAISRDFQQRVWIGTDQGIAVYEKNDSLVAWIQPDLQDRFALKASDISSFYLDRTGVLWIGTLSGGLYRTDTRPDRFKWYREDPERKFGLNNPLVWAILKDKRGRIWAGTDSGITIFNQQQKTIYLHSRNSPLQSDWIGAMYEDKEGVIWIGTSEALYRCDPSSYKMTRILLTDNPLEAGNEVYCIREGQENQLWIGTNNGLVLFDKNKRKIQRFFKSDSRPVAPWSIIYSIVPDSNAILWLGTYGGGLIRFNLHDFSRDTIHAGSEKGIGLSSPYVFSMIQDKIHPDYLWIGTRYGLNKYHKKTGEIQYFTEKEGLPNDVVYAVVQDRHGILWLSTNRGISRLDPETMEFRNFDILDGLQANEFNGRSVFQAADGEIFFGGINGCNSFYPDSIARKTKIFLPIITNIYSRNEEILHEERIPPRSDVHLSYRQNFITIHFFYPDYTNPLRVEFFYRMDGLEQEWHRTRRGTAEYTNLPGGKYRFQIKAINAEQQETPVTELFVIVHPPFYRTWWAYLLYIMLIGILTQVVVKIRINRIRRQEELKQALLKAKLAEAEKQVLEAENRKKMEEMERAREVQLAMLPKSPPENPFLEIAVEMKTASMVGGDYYDFFTLKDGSLLIALGDATGHGMPAGMTVALTKSGLLALNQPEPVKILEKMNLVLKDILADRFYMALQLMHFHNYTVNLASAAMPPVYYYHCRMSKMIEVLTPSLPLGTKLPVQFREITFSVQPGDLLFLLSDGLPEQMNAAGIPFGYDRLKETLQELTDFPPHEIIRKLLKIWEDYAQGSPLLDDITLMVMKIK